MRFEIFDLGFVIDKMFGALKLLILRIGLFITDHCGKRIQIMFTDDLVLTEQLEYSKYTPFSG